MGRKALFYWAALIGGYIVVSQATGFGKDIAAATGFVTATTKVLQGR
jgi:hypothetical protein